MQGSVDYDFKCKGISNGSVHRQLVEPLVRHLVLGQDAQDVIIYLLLSHFAVMVFSLFFYTHAYIMSFLL